MAANLRSKWLKALVFLACAAPLAMLIRGFQTDDLGPNPIEYITHATGDWTLRFLLATLAITPLRRTLNVPDLIRFRRMIGLYAFFYGCLHFVTWMWLDKFFDLNEMWADVVKRRFITMGMFGFVLMIPLAVTSTAGWIRRMGGKNWQRLHRLIYVSAAAGVVHYYWLVKSDIRLPALYGIILGTLVVWRAFVTQEKAPGACVNRASEARVPKRKAIMESDPVNQAPGGFIRVNLSRRQLMQAAAATALSASAGVAQAIRGPRQEGPNTPKICQQIGPLRHSSGGFDEAGMRRIKQLGVDYVLTSEIRAPWEEGALRESMARLKAAGLTLRHMYLPGLRNAVFGKPGRDEEIAGIIKNIQVAGKVGIPVLEYNWYGHRAAEGYYGETARGGSGITSFDYDRVKDLPPLPQVGAHSAEELWSTITYFLKAVIPEAEKAGVRLSIHPNDPPAPISRGSGQIVGSVEGWKRLIKIVDSPSNGITFDCGVTWETGNDPVEVCRYFGSRDRINHVHFRNVIVRKPNEKYSEVFIDAGEVNMFAVMKELVKQKYTHLIHPEHPRALDYDTQQPGHEAQYPGGGGYAGWAFNVAYTRAMLQAALDSQ